MKRLFVFLIAVLSFLSASAQYRDGQNYRDLYDSDIVTAIKAHVRVLSAADMEGRKAGSEGERLAAEYIGGKFAEYGVDILGPKDGELFGIRTENGDTLTSRNVIGFVQ